MSLMSRQRKHSVLAESKRKSAPRKASLPEIAVAKLEPLRASELASAHVAPPVLSIPPLQEISTSVASVNCVRTPA